MRSLNRNTLGKIGRFGEDIALDYLISQGYQIAGRNVVCSGNEIDIIVEDSRYIVFVEVKTRKRYSGRSKFGSAASAVDKNKQEHIISAAKSFLKENPRRKIIRFDVIEVYVDYAGKEPQIYKINHIPRAFGRGR